VPSTEFLLIRHAQSEWNAAGRWQGWADPPLSVVGREQAAAVARELAGEALDALVCSDLRRAVATAGAIGSELDLRPVPDSRFRERDVGTWAGLTRDEIAVRDAQQLARFSKRDDPTVCPGGGESDNDLERRVRPAVEEWADRYAGGRLALVTHLGVVRLLAPGSEPGHTGVTRVVL